MNKEKWSELKDKIESSFGGFEEEILDEMLEDDMGNTIKQKVEILVFNSPLGKIKIERSSHPKIIEKKAHYHKGAGGAKLEFIVDEKEESSHMTVYKMENDQWIKFDLPPEKISF